MNNSQAQRTQLSPEEFVEIDELLAGIDEKNAPMDVCEADGFMTAIHLLKKEPRMCDWIGMVFSTVGAKSTTGNAEADRRLVQLLKKRYTEIGEVLRNSELLDPAFFELEDENGKPVGGALAIAALEPFAMGFLEASQQWPELLNSTNPQIISSLMGVMRHLPKDALGDFAEVKSELDQDVPFANLPEALSDLSSCIAEIAYEVHGYPIPELDEATEVGSKSDKSKAH